MLCQCHQERLASHDEYAAVRRPVPAIDPVTRATPQCPYGQIQSKREPRVQPEPDMSMTSRFELLRTLLWSSGRRALQIDAWGHLPSCVSSYGSSQFRSSATHAVSTVPVSLAGCEASRCTYDNPFRADRAGPNTSRAS